MEPLEAIAWLTARERVLIAAARGRSSMGDPAPDKIAALVDVARALDAAEILHTVVGGAAVGIRSGVPRATMGTDLAVRSSTAREHLVTVLTHAGLTLKGEHAHSINFRHASGEPVQVVLDPDFDPMIDRAEAVDIGESAIRVVTTTDLIAMKERAAADPARRRSKALRDQADVALLRGDVPDPDEGW
jgi:hypothetical protein